MTTVEKVARRKLSLLELATRSASGWSRSWT